MKNSMIAILLTGYVIILFAVIAYLIRRSYRSYDGYVKNWLHKKPNKENPKRARMLKRAAGLKVKQTDTPPYSYEVVKAQLPFSDEKHFFTEISRSHLHHQRQTEFWIPQTPPIQERRNLPKLYVDCLSVKDRFDLKQSAADELKENSTNEFRKEIVYRHYDDVERHNELTSYHDSLSRTDSVMSLIEEPEFISPRSSPSSSRSSSEKRKSPSIKDKLKKKISHTSSSY